MKALVTRCMVCGAAIPGMPFYLTGRAAVRCTACSERAAEDLNGPKHQLAVKRGRAGAKAAHAKRKAGA